MSLASEEFHMELQGIIWREALSVILVVKVKKTVEEEMGKSDPGTLVQERFSFLYRLGWHGGRLLKKLPFAPFVYKLCNI